MAIQFTKQQRTRGGDYQTNRRRGVQRREGIS